MEPLIVNMFGEPCSGKSTSGAYLYAHLKMLGINAELVTEFVKDKCYEHNSNAIKYQPFILCNQMYKIHNVAAEPGIQVVIVDSPIPIGLLYNDCGSQHFRDFAIEEFNKYDNLNFVLDSDLANYTESGRVNTLEESRQIKQEMLKLLNKNKILYKIVKSDATGYSEALQAVLRRLKEKEGKNNEKMDS